MSRKNRNRDTRWTRGVVLVAAFALWAGLAAPGDALAVTMPFTFSAGATARASDVNANFQALNNGLPNFLGSSATPAATNLSLTSGPQTILSFLAAVPSAGQTVVTFSGTVCANHTAGTGENVLLQLQVDGTALTSSQQYIVPAAQATGLMCVPFSHTGVIANLGTGTHTFTLLGLNSSGLAYVNNVDLSGIVYH